MFPWYARGWVRHLALAVGSLAGVVLLGVLVGPAAAAVGLAGVIAVAAALRLIGLGRRTRVEHATRAEVANSCSVIANQVRVGRIPAEALTLAAEDAPVLAVAARVQRNGGDVVAALLGQAAAARLSGAPGPRSRLAGGHQDRRADG